MSERRKASKPTVKDVAREAGVSPITVSNVINSTGRFTEETAQRVREVIERIGYRPSVAARRFRLSKEWTIGLLVVDENSDFLSDPFTTAVITGLTNFLTEIGYTLTIRATKPSQFRTAGLFQGIQADGIVLMLSGTEAERRWFVEELLGFDVPIVLLQDDTKATASSIAVVRQDDFAGGWQVADRLLASGSQRFWVLVPRAVWPAMKLREKGFRSRLEQVPGIDIEIFVCGDESFDVTFEEVKQALASKKAPDAIVGLNDQMAIAAMRACQLAGFTVPDQIQITGFNGFEFWKFVNPTMTTVLSPAREIGHRAGDLLINMLKTGAYEQRDVVLPVTFRQGKSSKPVPVIFKN